MKKRVNSKVITAALQEIAARADGTLMPEDVVQAARSPSSPLHSQFDWTDTVAAHNWRLHQARGLINVLVEILPGADPQSEPSRVFVSLSRDRVKGGYHTMVDVLSDAESRAILLADAAAELESSRTRYQHLTELNNIFKVIKASKLDRFKNPSKKRVT